MNIPDLLEQAKQACEHAYAPYSRFPVGAAVLTDNGQVFRGVNVENASYGLTMCAERNAVFNAVQCGATRLTAIALFTPTESPVSPCGACRQVLREFAQDLIVVSGCSSGKEETWTLDSLLPNSFGPEQL